MITFLHAADIHLDSPLRGLERYEGAPVEEIRNATRRAFANLVALAIEEQVDFLVLAGDLYDGDWKDYNTGLYMVTQMTKLREAGIPVFLITGNHDAENKMTRKLPFPDNVRVFSTTEPQTHMLSDIGVALHGQGFANARVTQDLSVNYPAADPALFNIGLLHTCVTGREGHEPYAPCTLEGLRSRGYDYWALGHIHQREVLHNPHPMIIFPGNIQGRHIRETGAKGCLKITANAQHEMQTEFHALDVFRWELLQVDAGRCDHRDELFSEFSTQLEQAVTSAEGRPLAVRVEILGECAMHEQLASDRDRWINEIRSWSIQEYQDQVWIEKVKLRTRLPADRSQSTMEGPLAELTLLVEEIRQSPDLLREFSTQLEDLNRKVPPQLLENVKLSDATWLKNQLEDVEQMLIGRLLTTEDT